MVLKDLPTLIRQLHPDIIIDVKDTLRYHKIFLIVLWLASVSKTWNTSWPFIN
jgi:hypothetical protein